jgi:hypothetical protein
VFEVDVLLDLIRDEGMTRMREVEEAEISGETEAVGGEGVVRLGGGGTGAVSGEGSEERRDVAEDGESSRLEIDVVLDMGGDGGVSRRSYGEGDDVGTGAGEEIVIGTGGGMLLGRGTSAIVAVGGESDSEGAGESKISEILVFFGLEGNRR